MILFFKFKNTDLLETGIYFENRNENYFNFAFATSLTSDDYDTKGGGMGVAVESGCKRIYNDQNEYFLDLIPTDYDICNFVRAWVSSTNLYRGGASCDILCYHRF